MNHNTSLRHVTPARLVCDSMCAILPEYTPRGFTGKYNSMSSKVFDFDC